MSLFSIGVKTRSYIYSTHNTHFSEYLAINPMAILCKNYPIEVSETIGDNQRAADRSGIKKL